MTHPRTAPRCSRLLAALASVALGLTVLGTLAPSIAPAAVAATPTSPVGSAKERAHQLRLQLAALQTKAEAATEDYNAAQAALGAVVTQHLLAQRQLEQAQATVGTSIDTEAQTVRALYRAGGPAALYATILDGTDPGDAYARINAVRTIVAANRLATDSARTFVGGAAAIEARLATLAHRQTVLQRSVSQAMDSVEAALGQQQQLVAAADAEVLRLQQEEAATAAAAAARRAGTTLAAARASAVPGGPGDVTAPDTAAVDAAIAAARAQLGKPYRWGATGPDTFDCSGLTGWAYAQAGVALPRTSRQQWFAGPHPGLGYLAPGDLLFWATDPANPATIHHVAIYIGGDDMIAAPHTGADVTIQPVYLDGYIGAVRPTRA